MDILQAIGDTSLVRLRKIVPSHCADIFVKLEWENPTGSMKDRMALAVISRAEADGRLKAGDTVVEYTGGSTGAALAFICAVKGYRLKIVTSDAFSQEKRDHMAALGAELTLIPSEGGLATRKLFLDMIETAREMSRQPHTYWINQLENRDSTGVMPGSGCSKLPSSGSIGTCTVNVEPTSGVLSTEMVPFRRSTSWRTM